MKYLLLTALLLLSPELFAQDSFTLYLVRHAEKQVDQEDPPLSQCGQLRAKELAKLLSMAEIEHIYSTAFKRTMATAAPLAKQQQLAIKNYQPASLYQLAHRLLKEKRNAVVVGHSNTTPQLAALLSEKDVADISEKKYQDLYQIHVNGSNKKLTLLTQPLTCK